VTRAAGIDSPAWYIVQTSIEAILLASFLPFATSNKATYVPVDAGDRKRSFKRSSRRVYSFMAKV
jgi:hypothetical protein